MDVVIFTIENGALKVLLIRRPEKPFANKWALPGGFLFKNETSAEAAKRILKDKAGVNNVYLEQLYTFDDPNRDPRGHVLTVSYFALVNFGKIKFLGKDAQTPTFHPTGQLPKLAFDHKEIVNYSVRRLRYKLEYTNAVYSILPANFTFGELQQVHETILDKKMDKRNFRKKFMSLGLIKSVNKKLTGARQRPAELFRFAIQKPRELKRFL